MLKPKMTLAVVLAALFPKSEKAIAEKLDQSEFDAFASEAQEVQNRLDAQADGNEAVKGDLTNANASLKETQDKLTASEAALTKATADLATANSLVGELKPKAAAWDAHKAALDGANVTEDSTNTKGGKANSDLSQKDQDHLTRLTELKAKYPGLMAGINVPTIDEE